MYPTNYSIGWLGYKGGEPIEEAPKVGSVAKAWQWRESGINPPNQLPNKTVLENNAEDILVQKPLQITSCDLPGYPRSTFLMVFSPDGTKLASTHGNHNIYVSELASGKHVRILRGHPRTPWCIAFHPSHPQLIGSGCLGGQVRVWDIASGGSEVWSVYNETVIASIAFHPREQLLVIATYNELYFWDWSQPAPFTKVSTNNINEKVRYVAFDSLGFKLITGISLWACATNANGTPLVSVSGPLNPSNRDPGSNSNPGNGGPGYYSGFGNNSGSDNNTGSGNNDGGNSGGPGNNSGFGNNGGSGNNSGFGNNNGFGNNRGSGYNSGSGNNSGTGNNVVPGSNGGSCFGNGNSRDDDGLARQPDTPGAAEDMIVNSYQTLVQRYDSLVRNYQRLFMVRHRLINTPPLANTIDRGTDPMETYPPETGRPRRRLSRRSTRSTSSTTQNNPGSPAPSTSRQEPSVGAPRRIVPFDAINLNELLDDYSAADTRSPDSSVSGLQGVPVFRSITSAFQPLGDERTTRLLPNPFSSTNGGSQQPNSSRTSGIFRGRPESALSALRQFSIRSRNLDAAETAARAMTTAREAVSASRNADSGNTDVPMRPACRPHATPQAHLPSDPQFAPLPSYPPPARPPPPPEPAPQSDDFGVSSTQAAANLSTLRGTDPSDPDGEAHTINESLDLIRDILRDSGTRLLNLITNMSMNILSNSERDESARVPVHVFTGNLRRDFMASSSDSESEHPEVNITRTPNATFRERVAPDATGDRPLSARPAAAVPDHPQNSSSAPQISDRMTFEPEIPSEGQSRVDAINISDRMTFELDETVNETPSREGRINVSLANERFRVRTQNKGSRDPSQASTSAASSEPSTSRASRDEPQPGPSSAPDSTAFEPSVPSTSTHEHRRDGAPVMPAGEAMRRVQLGVSALQKHTLQLANMWLRGDRTTLRELRTMWEDLRRRMMMLYREAGGRADAPSFYTRSLLERCMILTELSDIAHLPSRPLGRMRRSARNAGGTSGPAMVGQGSPSTARTEEASSSNLSATGNATANTPSASNRASASSEATAAADEPSSSTNPTNENRNSRAARAHRMQRNKRLVRLQQAYRWRTEDDMRRRERNAPSFRGPQLRTRHRSNLMRSVEQNATRHVIRTRAMKVLSVMFNMMMMCLEERGLSQLIINMLKTLKKALALTCFMMMSNRNMPREGGAGAATPAAQSVASADVVRIQSAEHSGPVNVEDTSDPHCLRVVRYDEPSQPAAAASSSTQTAVRRNEPTASTAESTSAGPSQAWSHRLAVQIAAANRNTSSTAKTRRDMYLEARRQKALHRANPITHPLIRRRFPPLLAHRIPSIRSMPPGRFHHRVSPRSPPPGSDAGPSTSSDNPNDPSLPPHGCENFVRLAHIRLRTAARNRFRRLQTIRLYTPSSVREMFALQDFQHENRSDAEAPAEDSNEPPVGGGGSIAGPNYVRAQFHARLAGLDMLPLMHVNDLAPAAEAQAGQPHRLPRIHEYLQPIILAQNAMVVDDSDGSNGPQSAASVHLNRRLGGMAGLLDAGIISEALPAPSHRVQAWDFTSGAVPDIADSTKNMVVQRCRIHNDASIDISKDGRLLVALLPVPRLRNTNNWLGVYSLEWPRLGQCLHTAVLEQSAVSVALSPTARYLAVGLGSRRFTSSHSRTNIIALLYKLDPLESSSRTGLSPMKELEQYWEHGFTSLNCLRWAPQPGQGLVYANNTGQLIIMS